jgi:hypothetical protein
MPLNASQLVIFIVIHQKNNGKCTFNSAYETLAVARQELHVNYNVQ